MAIVKLCLYSNFGELVVLATISCKGFRDLRMNIIKPSFILNWSGFLIIAELAIAWFPIVS